MPVILFGLERSVYTRVARLALEEKGVAYELRDTEIFGPEGVPPEHRARHPFGRIPVLQHKEFVLYETAAIARYVDEAFDGPVLQPAAPDIRARMNQVIGIVDAYGYRPMVWDVFVERFARTQSGQAPDETKIGAGLAAAERCLQAIEQLASPSPYMLGANPTLADLHLLPVLACFALAPDGRAQLARHPALSRWLDLMNGRPSVERTRFPLERGQ